MATPPDCDIQPLLGVLDAEALAQRRGPAASALGLVMPVVMVPAGLLDLQQRAYVSSENITTTSLLENPRPIPCTRQHDRAGPDSQFQIPVAVQISRAVHDSRMVRWLAAALSGSLPRQVRYDKCSYRGSWMSRRMHGHRAIRRG